MNKLFVSLVAVMAASSVVMAQGQGGGQGRGQGGPGGRMQEVSVPVKVLYDSLPLTKEKLDVLVADIKVLNSVQLPVDAVLELKLTVDQKKSLTEIAKQNQEKVREMMQSGDREGVMALREAVAAKASGVLTEDQKKVIAKYPARMGGGRQGGGRPGGPPSK